MLYNLLTVYDLRDTIAAICTPKGISSIAAIRLSGSESWNIVKKIFESKIPKHSFHHMQAVHGYIKDKDKIIDEVIILPYKSPHSFTTEDIVEMFCHGGIKVPSMVLDLCLKNGARFAKPGEFTFRAFIKGRIDLTGAEAINEIINSFSDKAVWAATENITGALKQKVNLFREKLSNLVTLLEGAIEFPMEVENKDGIDSSLLSKDLISIKKELDELIKSSKEGRILRDGAKVAIIGLPNAGKSSLLNQMLDTNRAIVTEVPGTTRDTIEEKIILDGWPVVLVDTAGIREHKYANDPERHGIERTRTAITNSDIVLFLTDLTNHKNNGKFSNILELIGKKSKITVGNKIDLLFESLTSNLPALHCDITISAKHGTNIKDLKTLIVEKIKSQFQPNSHKEQTIFVNERQKELLLQASSSIEEALSIAEKKLPDDFISDELKKAISKLDEVTGRIVNEDVIKNIFSRFCIGK